MKWIKSHSLYFAWVIALAATLGSLFLSEVKAWPPCSLCWYQRICLFPMVWLLGVAAFKQDFSVRIYVIPLLGLGALFAFIQALRNLFPSALSSSFCGGADACSVHLALPWVSLLLFAAMIALVLSGHKKKR